MSSKLNFRHKWLLIIKISFIAIKFFHQSWSVHCFLYAVPAKVLRWSKDGLQVKKTIGFLFQLPCERGGRIKRFSAWCCFRDRISPALRAVKVCPLWNSQPSPVDLLTWKTAGWLKMPPDMTGHYDTCSLSNAAFTGDSIIFGSFHSGCTAQGQRRCFELVAYEQTLGRLKQSTAIPGQAVIWRSSPPKAFIEENSHSALRRTILGCQFWVHLKYREEWLIAPRLPRRETWLLWVINSHDFGSEQILIIFMSGILKNKGHISAYTHCANQVVAILGRWYFCRVGMQRFTKQSF